MRPPAAVQSWVGGGFAVSLLAIAAVLASSGWASAEPSPIQHVVVIYQENHSFDELLGALCVQDSRCDGATSGVTATGEVIPLGQEPDIIPPMNHGNQDQRLAIDDGKMDDFSLMPLCTEATGYACYVQVQPAGVPNLSSLARAFALSDRTFEAQQVASWPSHIELVAAGTDGFLGGPRLGTGGIDGPGWGCDSGDDARWQPFAGGPISLEPSCIPKPDGSGPYRPTQVPFLPTIMDELRDAGLSWRIYAPRAGEGGYGWAICPTFAECLYTNQVHRVKPSDAIIKAASKGQLPSFSVVIPGGETSQHNTHSLLVGDNWIGSVVSAIENGPDWSSTAIFIVYDDCGCFYDHVAPPDLSWGVRVPMVIVSPYARPGFTDSSPATTASLLAFTEHTFGLPPLGLNDASAYDFGDALDYTQRPLAPVPMVTSTVPAWELAYMASHPADPADAT